MSSRYSSVRTLRTLAAKLRRSEVRLPRRLNARRFCSRLAQTDDETTSDEESARISPMGIQMVSSALFDQLFASDSPPSSSKSKVDKALDVLPAKHHLDKFGLWDRPTTLVPDVAFRLPPLIGSTLDEHFRRIAERQTRPYKEALDRLSDCSLPPFPSEWRFAAGWTKYPNLGSSLSAEPESVAYPDGDALVFDVEVCMNEDSHVPTLAVAASATHWFSWSSERLVDECASAAAAALRGDQDRSDNTFGSVDDLIPLEHPDPAAREPKIVVGHNVAFDRSFVREQYAVEPRDSLVRFLDTMSLHIAVAGFTAEQRTMFAAAAKGADPTRALGSKFGTKYPNLHWMNESTTNALKDVYAFYCGDKLTKEERNIFVDGTIDDVRANFHQLMDYCAKDVRATQQILTHLAPLFFSRFPHPVSFGGTLEMGRCYLPVDDTWPQFIENCNEAFEDLKLEQTKILKRLSGYACRLVEGAKYAEDPWLWDLDWKISSTKFLKRYDKPKVQKSKRTLAEMRELCETYGFTEDSADAILAVLSTPHVEDLCQLEFHSAATLRMLCRLKNLPVGGSKPVLVGHLRSLSQRSSTTAKVDDDAANSDDESHDPENPLSADDQLIAEARRIFPTAVPNDLVKSVLSTRSRIAKNQITDMIGYPEWYRGVCQRWNQSHVPDDFCFGPVMSNRIQYVPKLLKLRWREYPVHHVLGLGWGYLVPVGPLLTPLDNNIRRVCEDSLSEKPDYARGRTKVAWEDIEKRLTDGESFADAWEAVKALRLTTNDANEALEKKFRLEKERPDASSLGPHVVEDLPSCQFYKVPHVAKAGQNVGNLLAKTFQGRHDDGTLTTAGMEDSHRVIQIAHQTSFWVSIRERIRQQMVVRTRADDSSDLSTEAAATTTTPPTYAILPRVIVAGTITRRAVEKTWLVVSNPTSTRIGSELKAMVRAPPGWHFVGADVDSQELWIASLLGDASFCGEHGCTALGWMLLQGRKEDGTDMHSRTAAAAGCTRSQAKVLNYSRIYGAGTKFAATLLTEFNRDVTPAEADRNARNMMRETKGYRRKKIVRKTRQRNSPWNSAWKNYDDDDDDDDDLVDEDNAGSWYGGTESHMFNKLESIANSPEPRTPALGARISLAAEPGVVGDSFLRSRINWVVQSSAVDYLHLLLVGVRYLFDAYDIRGRISLSIHDEVRFLVASEDRYRATLALQIANLWTRALFASKVGIDDLPMSVAFFSAVEIDSVLRKDVDEQAVTPSNPDGLGKQYGVDPGEALDIYQVMAKTNGGQMRKMA